MFGHFRGGLMRLLCSRVVSNESRVGGACGPPPPFVAPLVPRCALTPGATPRDVLGRRIRLGRPKKGRELRGRSRADGYSRKSAAEAPVVTRLVASGRLLAASEQNASSHENPRPRSLRGFCILRCTCSAVARLLRLGRWGLLVRCPKRPTRRAGTDCATRTGLIARRWSGCVRRACALGRGFLAAWAFSGCSASSAA
jgi:hypothetical protein